MTIRPRNFVLMLSLLALAPTLVQAQDSATIWKFLGIPQGLSRMRSQVVNRRGNVPGLEKKPPLKAIADPANLESPWEPIKIAAEVKQAEDAAPQKIKAVKFLAGIGCGCYDKKLDGAVTDAIVAAMDDCTESVRLAAIEAVTEVACSEACEKCGQRSCCNDKIIAQLATIAYERDETGCYLEPSEDVRQAAIEGLQCCCQGDGDIIIEDGLELETAPDLERPGVPEVSPAPPTSTEAFLLDGERINIAGSSSRRGFETEQLFQNVSDLPAGPLAPPQTLNSIGGVVRRVDTDRGLVYLRLDHQVTLETGTEVEVYHQFLLGTGLVAKLEVVSSLPGSAVARAASASQARKVARNDTITGWTTYNIPQQNVMLAEAIEPHPAATQPLEQLPVIHEPQRMPVAQGLPPIHRQVPVVHGPPPVFHGEPQHIIHDGGQVPVHNVSLGNPPQQQVPVQQIQVQPESQPQTTGDPFLDAVLP